MNTTISDLEADFLNAARELVLRQQELLPLIEERIGMSAYEYWIEGSHGMKYDQKFGNRGTTRDGKWNWCFHGFECGISNVEDKRSIDVYFGPNGRTDTFIYWNVLLFVYGTRSPWREFSKLKTYFGDPLSNEAADRAIKLCERLQSNGCVGYADPVGAEWLMRNNGRMVPREYILSGRLAVTE